MKKDSGRSVVILCGVTFTVIVDIGIIKGFSVLLPTLKEQFSTKTWIIGSSISILYGWGFLLGLSASLLQKRFGLRWSIALTGIISSIGIIVCAIAKDMYTFLIGLLLIGFLLPQENLTVGAIPDYFDKHYNVAVKVYCLGTAIAIMIFPPMTQFLFEIYGWRGTSLLFCGINLHTLLCGALFETEKDTMRSKYDELQEDCPDCMDSSRFPPSVLQRLQTILTEFDFEMVTSLPYICRIILPGVVFGYTFSAWAIYIISYALSTGNSLKEASIISTSGGIGIAAIRIVSLLPCMNSIASSRLLMYISSLLMTLSMVLTTMFQSYAHLCVSSFIFGVGIGMLGTEIYVAARDVAREDQYVNAVSWYHLFYGFAMIVGATITGAVFDATNSFIISFLILSAVSSVTLVSLAFEDIWMKFNTKQSAPL